MTAKKVYRYLFGLLAVSIVASFLLVRYAANWLAESSVELTSLRGELNTLDTQWTNLEKAKKILADQSEDVEALGYILPKDKEQARVVEELYSIADQSNVTIDSVGFPSSTLGSTQKTTAPVTPPAETTTTASDATTTQNQATATPTQTVSQATPVKEIPGVQSIELSIGTITSKDTSIKGIRYQEMIDLLRLIERNRRTMQIRSIGIGQTQNPDGTATYDLTLSIVIFIKP